MKIVINGKFLLHRITGVERYAREILNELDKIASKDEFCLLVPKNVKDIPVYKNIKVIKYGYFKNNLWEQISLPHYVKKNKAKCYNLCNVSPLRCPHIVTVFDMKVYEHPEFYSWKFVKWYKINLKNSIKYSSIIFTDSLFAKKQILKYFPKIDSNKIVVTYCGYEHFDRIEYDENTLKKYNIDKYDYYFAMGSLDPNKNFEFISKLAKKNQNYNFIIAGSVNEHIFKKKYGFDLPNNMKLIGYVSDSEAKTLMRDSKSFLFPSVYEGFGIPPLEAISAGCKNVIVSNIEVFHEIYGDNVSYFHTESLENNYIKEIDYSIILNKYSWKKSAAIVLKTLKEMENV